MYVYNGSEILCRKCIEEDIPEAQLAKYLDEYVEQLPADIRVSAAEFNRRLAICAGCEHLLKYTCRLCGCYAQVHAAKRMNRCPVPYAPKWDVCQEDADIDGQV